VVYCPIENIKIWTYDGSSFTDVTSSDNAFTVTSKTNLRTWSNSIRDVDYYISGHTAGGVIQDYYKMKLTICSETVAAVGTEITSAYAY